MSDETISPEYRNNEPVNENKNTGLKKSIKKKVRNAFLLSIGSLIAVSGIGLYTSQKLTESVSELQQNTVALKRQGLADMMHEGLDGDALNWILLAYSNEDPVIKSKAIEKAKSRCGTSKVVV